MWLSPEYDKICFEVTVNGLGRFEINEFEFAFCDLRSAICVLRARITLFYCEIKSTYLIRFDNISMQVRVLVNFPDISYS